MELKFVETIEGKEWEAEFEAHSDFNLHLERVKGGSLVVSQRGTTSGEYAAAFAKGMYEGQAVIDYDFGALVYPKWIKVVSGSKVVSASVNFNEGGGSGSESGSGNLSLAYFYIDRNTTDSYLFDNAVAGNYGVLYGYTFNGDNIVSAKYVLDMVSILIPDVSYFAVIDGTIPQINVDTNAMEDINNANQIREAIKSMSSTQCHIREITKEQFYNLEA